MRLYDNTRLSDFKRCPRLFFFRHVLGWVPKGTKVPLVFGGAWHSAMEVVWGTITRQQDISAETLTKAAYAAFLEHWEREGMPANMSYEQIKELSPRTPGKAFEMIAAYVADRRSRFSDFEIIAIEQPFMVPLDPNDPELFYVGKIDKIVRYQGKKVLGIEHKTTTAYSKSNSFKSLFLDSFSPNSQVDGYQYALHMLYPGEAGGVWVDAALVHKEEEAFKFIPVEKQLRYLDSWLWDTREWIKAVEGQKAELCLTDSSDPYMRAFPKNTNSCWDFMSACAYHHLCKAWPNPLGRDMPEEYEHRKWDPLEEVKGLKELLNESGNDARTGMGGGGCDRRPEDS